MTPQEASERFAGARVARLATTTPAGAPHIVPVCFAVAGDAIYTAVDAKPKRTTALARLRNVAADARVAVLADHYDEDWSQLWWARADGTATIVGAESPDASGALALLRRRYDQYRTSPPAGPVLAVAVHRWSGWSAS